VDDFASYEGSSGFLRWWPKILLGLAFGVAVVHWSHWVQFATVLVVCAWLHGRLLPWRFATGASLAASTTTTKPQKENHSSSSSSSSSASSNSQIVSLLVEKSKKKNQ